MPTVIHPFLNDGVEARAYQIRSLRSALTSSTLMVMPTGFGKTAVEWMMMAEILKVGEGKILLIAPTTGLVEQQQRMARDMLRYDNEKIIRYTGETPPKKRPELWNTADIVIATSQVIRNDSQSGVIDLNEVSLLIVDEAHHATGNHAYAQVGDIYLERNSNAMVLAATASPGSTESSILEVAKRLGIERLDISRREEPLLQPYAVELENIPIRVDLPDELITLIHPLQLHQNEEIKRLQRMGFLAPSKHLTSKIIDDAQKSASMAIQRRDARGYDAAKRISDLRRMHLLLDLIRTQGMKSALSYLERAEEDGRSGDRGTNRFVSLRQIHDFRIASKELPELNPKTHHVQSLVQEQLKDKPKSKILIFTEYRDTVTNLILALDSIESSRADKFIGQSSRGKQKGMTQKQQLEQLKRFREGDINVLVATSVGEEGLDVPSADLVLLYEPVPSAIRAIQRRGRTARQTDGTVKTLIAKNTRDEFVHSAAKIREQRMYTLLDRIQKRGRLPRRPPATNDILSSFKVLLDDQTVIESAEFLHLEIDRLITNIPLISPEVEIENKQNIVPESKLEAKDRRPRNQMGLDSFIKSKQEIGEQLSNLDPIQHRNKESKSISAAKSEIESMIPKKNLKLILDHREASSSLAAYLRSMGVEVVFEHLKYGDIQLSDNTIIERKTSRDLLNSLIDGRLMKQCHKLIECSEKPLLLIELGEVGNAVHPNAVLGAMAHITLDLGIPVMMTKNTIESSHFLTIAAKRESDIIEALNKSSLEIRSINELEVKKKIKAAQEEIGLLIEDEDYQSALLGRWNTESLRLRIKVLTSIPGIGEKRAKILIEHFGTIAAVLTSSKDELIKIDSITEVVAEKIITIINK
jgi:ERCC4-related helicase/ERCC4-type nuclease